ncbi:MAG: ATP-grasp domain-containing protein [Lysinibacillus sp.]
MRKKPYMILGGSVGQIPAILTSKKLGFETIVIDRDETAVGATYADIFEAVNTIDIEAATAVAKKYNVAGTMTISSDIAVPTVCAINEALNLPNQGVGIGQNVTDKAVMRKLFEQVGVKSPTFIAYHKDEPFENLKNQISSLLQHGPYIVKPTDSSGSRGVTKISAIEQLHDAVANALSFTRNDKIVIEQFIDGIEIGAQSFVVNGHMVKCFIHNDKVSNNMIPIGHSFPYVGDEKLIAEINEQCAKAMNALGIKNGPANIDIIVTPSNEAYVIEIGARIGATKLPEIVEAYSGWDMIAATILLSVGDSVTLEETQRVPVAVEMLYFEEEYIVERIGDYSDILEKFKPLSYEINIKPQQHIRPLRSGVDVYGFVICTGQSAEDAERNCELFMHAIKAKINFKK